MAAGQHRNENQTFGTIFQSCVSKIQHNGGLRLPLAVLCWGYLRSLRWHRLARHDVDRSGEHRLKHEQVDAIMPRLQTRTGIVSETAPAHHVDFERLPMLS